MGDLNEELLAAIIDNDPARAKTALDSGAIGHRQHQGMLQHAARCGYLELVRLLLEHGAAGKDGALGEAANYGHLAVSSLLLDHQADIEAGLPLLNATQNGHLDVVRLLCQRGADIHAGNDRALQTAAMRGKADIVEFLLDLGADIHAKDDLALRLAYDCAQVTRLLLDRGADATACNYEALCCAAYAGYLDVVDTIAQHIFSPPRWAGKSAGEVLAEGLRLETAIKTATQTRQTFTHGTVETPIPPQRAKEALDSVANHFFPALQRARNAEDASRIKPIPPQPPKPL